MSVSPPYRYHLTYSGMKLPLNLVEPLRESDIGNRNTFFRSRVDVEERLILVEKMVYGEVELTHRYAYRDDGTLLRAEIAQGDDEAVVLRFDAAGKRLSC